MHYQCSSSTVSGDLKLSKHSVHTNVCQVAAFGFSRGASVP